MLAGKTIIITGGSGSLGVAMGKKFVEEGANVLLAARNIENLESAKNKVLQVGETVDIFSVDIRDPEQIKAMLAFALERFGEVHGLINNAAGNFVVESEKLSPNGWKAVIDIVLNGSFNCTSIVGNYWIEKGVKGMFLNMVTTYAWDAAVGVIHSGAAKAGVLSMTRTLAVEWGHKYGIRSNAIAPGPIADTQGTDKLYLDKQAIDRSLENIPLKRWGRPEEIADLAAFMFSEKALYMNGECITLDGGFWLNRYPF